MEVCLFDGYVWDKHLMSYASDRDVPNEPQAPNPALDRYVFTLFGRTDRGESVALVLSDAVVRAYVRLNVHQSQNPEQTLSDLRRLIPGNHHVATRVIQRFSAFGYEGTEAGRTKRWFIELRFLTKAALSQCRGILSNNKWELCSWQTLQADMYQSKNTKAKCGSGNPGKEQPALLQQLLQQIPGTESGTFSWFSWVTIDPSVQVLDCTQPRFTTCTYEIRAALDQVRALPHDITRPICPKRLLSFDLECANRINNDFVVPEKDPVACIGNTVMLMHPISGMVTQQQIVFSYTERPDAPAIELRADCPLPDSEATFEMRIFSGEAAMIEAWRDWVIESDIDVILGYNTFIFDNPYLLKRMAILRPRSRFFRLGRIRRAWATLHKGAKGATDITVLGVPGLAEIDVYLVARNMFTRFVSYALGAIANQVLNGYSKLPLHFTEIFRCFKEGDDQRIAAYCVRDTELPLMLLNKWGTMHEQIAVSQLTFCTLHAISTNGPKGRVDALIRGGAHELGFVANPLSIPKDKYEGATVIKPSGAFHTRPILTCDYMSLYPTMIIHWNLCMSTLCYTPQSRAHLPREAYHTIVAEETAVAPRTEWHFVKDTTAPGILPHVMRQALSARAHAKKLLATAKRNGDAPHIIKSLDSRQLALKTVANSVYGVLSMVCFPIAVATTACGRMALATARRIAEAPPYYCRIIYGDTDSIMVDFAGPDGKQVLTLKEANDEGDKLANAITEHFVAENPNSPVVMQNEKTYLPYLIAKKKRYCGIKYEGGKQDFDVKGFDLVRRSTITYIKDLFAHIFNICMECDTDKKIPDCYRRIMEHISTVYQQLAGHLIPRAALVTSSSLKRNYANPKGLAQCQVNEQIARVHPGTEFDPGNRVPYLVLTGTPHFHDGQVSLRGPETSKMAERAVYPPFCDEWPVLGENLDWEYYLDRSRSPLLQVLRLLSPDRADDDLQRIYQPILDCIRRNAQTFAKFNHVDIRSFFRERGVETGVRELSSDFGEKRPLHLPKAPKVALKKARVCSLNAYLAPRTQSPAACAGAGAPRMMEVEPNKTGAVAMEVEAPTPLVRLISEQGTLSALPKPIVPKPAAFKTKAFPSPARRKAPAPPPPSGKKRSAMQGSVLAYVVKKK